MRASLGLGLELALLPDHPCPPPLSLSLTSHPAVAVFGVLGDFLLQISFFAGWMALDARRQAAGKHDLFCLNPCGASTPPACKRYFTLQVRGRGRGRACKRYFTLQARGRVRVRVA